MSTAKWRSIQHRHRYTCNAVVFPPQFILALNQMPNDSPFFAELNRLVSLNSTYAQLEHAKKVASGFANLLSHPKADENLVSCAVRLYLEILFLENSSPLHRTLVSVLAKCSNFRGFIRRCFRQLCEEYAYGGGENGRNLRKRFCVSRAALSMMSTPKLGYLVEVVEQCVILVGLDVVSGLGSVVAEANESSRPSPIVMEQCQEALSCLYYLLQRFPEKFCNAGIEQRELGLNDQSVLERAFSNVLIILSKSQAFSRDCFVAAGVSFCASLQVCLTPEELGLFIMQGIFHQMNVHSSNIDLNVVIGKIPCKGDLVGEISNFSALSRLCLIRGILTAVSRTVLDSRYVLSSNDGLNGRTGISDGGHSIKTILYDAILPELCSYAENPTDSHSNFHALTVMQICLQQIKTLLHCDTSGIVDDYNPIDEEMGGRILKIVWNNLEDPLSQTVKQVHLIFDLYLDILSGLPWADSSENTKLFLRKIASDLLCLGPRCKGRYVPLASLTRRLGAKAILGMNPDLLFETTKAYIDDDVCCAATTFLKCFLECLRDEYWSSDGVGDGYTKYRGHCLHPFLQGLSCGLAKLRSNLSTYALPVLLELDGDCIFHMLSLIGTGWDEGPLFDYIEISSSHLALGLEQQIAVLISLLKVSRVLALMEGDIDLDENEVSLVSPEGIVLDVEDCNLHCLINIKSINVKVPVKWLALALTHIDESLRMDAAETLFLNPKTSHLPSSLELSLMRRAIPLNMRCSSSAFQMKWNSLFRKFFSRVRTALERQLKQGAWKPLASQDTNGAENPIKHGADNLFNFTKWLSCFLFFSCYPSAPYERKIMAMDLILVMLNVWPLVPTLAGNQDALYPYSKNFTLPDTTLQLVGSIIDSWDRLRVSSFRILLNFPTPLPGIGSPDLVREAIIWAKKLVCSPRVRESDAGALTLRLLFRNYVLELGWIVKPSCNVVSFGPKPPLQNGTGQNSKSNSPVVIYVISLIDWLLSSVEDAERNLLEACENSFVHGILLTLRFTFEELDWNSSVLLDSFAEMKHALERLLELVMRITSLALWVVSADAWHMPEDMEDIVDDELFLLENSDEIDSSGHKLQSEDEDKKVVDVVRSSEQIVMVGCWLAMKELSLLLGTVIRKVPLPTYDERMDSTIANTSDEAVLVSDGMLDLKQLETIGNHFLEVLVKMKHNGAIDKTRAGFTALCNRLLCSDDSRLCKLTESWMEQLMERMVAKGQTVDDLLRRSAGIPAAFIAFFLSEPEGTPKRLLPRALRWLIDVIKESKAFTSNSSRETSTPPPGTDDKNEMSKFRDEGVVPTVHAFNVLRAAFNDTNLATDTSGFCAEALIFAIRSFSSLYWEVRNSACLAYTALVRRMVGFLNIHKRESARRAITGLEFFHRYPALHPFLFDELKVATELLSNGSSKELEANLKNSVHPSLCPMLILLSRLKPSPLSSETGDPLDPFLFMPCIRKCAVLSNFQVRVLASGALVGLVANEKLQEVMLNIASELPCEGSHFNAIHGMLLQLDALVDTNCRNLADSFKKDKIFHELVEILAVRQWIGRPQQCPCPILNGCLLRVLDNMLSIARTCQGSLSAGGIWNLLWKLSSECLDLEHASGWSYFDPTIQELRKQAATSYFNCIFQTSKEAAEDDLVMSRHFFSPCQASSIVGVEVAFMGFQQRLIRSMSDASYEVRIATLKWLHLFLKRNESSGICYKDQFYCEAMKICSNNINIQDMLMKLMVSEKHHKCMRYLIKILYTWNSLEFQGDSQPSTGRRYISSMDWNLIFQLWNKLVSLLEITRHAKTRESLICLLGTCIKQISNLYLSSISSEVQMKKTTGLIQIDQSSTFSDFYNSLSYYVNLIEQKSDASQPVNMRKAAAESLIASGLLSHADVLGPLVSSNQISDRYQVSNLKLDESIRLYARKILDLWLTCIKLLEDEDVGIRKRLALDIQKYSLSRKSKQNNGPVAVSCQVEKVIELCFKHLSTTFGHWPDYLDYLCCWVMNAANNTNYTISGDLVRRVFDKEIDNHHEEKLLICQLCCSQMEDVHLSEPEARDVLYKWRSRFFERLMAFIHERMGKGDNVDWIGGVGNHKDVFLPLYGNLLAFNALSKRIWDIDLENSSCLMSKMSALEDAIRPFLGNPLISNLYSIVTSHGERLAEIAAGNLTQKWVEFNPYFLLR